MKKDDIKLGKDYTDGRGIIRRVIGVGPEFKAYDTQRDTDCVRYKVIFRGHGTKGPSAFEGEYNTTRTSFAKWADCEV